MAVAPYGTLAGLRAYHTARGNDALVSASDADAEAALIRGADMVRLRYVSKIETLPDPIPDDFAEAEYEAALVEIATPGFFSRTTTPGQERVLTRVADIQWTVIEAGTSTAAGVAVPISTKVDEIMGPYLASSSTSYGIGVMTV